MYSNTQQQQRQNAHLDRLRDDLPTHESPFGTDFKPTHGGAGSLPGGRDESGVARLPDEIAQEGRGGFNNNNNIPGATQPVGTGTGQTFGAAGLPAYERTQEGGGYNDNNKLNSTIPGTKQPVSTGQTYETSRFQEIPGQRESADERIPGTYGYDPRTQDNQDNQRPSRVEQTDGDIGHDEKPSLTQKVKQGIKDMTSGLKK